jgi:stage III sporulation protein SpoIIIAA
MTAKLTYKELQAAISRAYRNGDTHTAHDLETEAMQRRNAARDRWAEEAADKAERESNRRKYGNFYGMGR